MEKETEILGVDQDMSDYLEGISFVDSDGVPLPITLVEDEDLGEDGDMGEDLNV